MSGARVSAFLGLDISHFTAGLDKAKSSLVQFKRLMGSWGGGSLGGLVGISALVAGFRSILNSAQQARDAAHEMGTAIDISTLATARMADGIDDATSRLKEGATYLAGLYGRGMNWLAVKTGIGSSLEEQDALKRAEGQQARNEIALQQNSIRLTKERESAEQALTTATKARKDLENDTSDVKRFERLNRELDRLYEKLAETPASIVRTKILTEIEKLTTDVINVSRRIEAARPAPGFGIKLSDAAGGVVGRRSERERLADDAMTREARGRRAEAAGNMTLAAEMKRQAEELARRAGFSGGKTFDGRRVTGPAAGGTPGEGATWDERWGGMLAERNASLNARYGAPYRRPAEFEARDRAINAVRPFEFGSEAPEGSKLDRPAEKIDKAAEEMKTAVEDFRDAVHKFETMEIDIDRD